MGKTELTELSV